MFIPCLNKVYVCIYVCMYAPQLIERSSLRNTFYSKKEYVCMYACMHVCMYNSFAFEEIFKIGARAKTADCIDSRLYRSV